MCSIDGVGIPKTAEFKYLGSMFAIEDTLGIQRDVNRRLALAHAAFGQLRHVWNSRSISRRIKAQLLLSCVGSVLTYGSEHWTLSAGIVRRMTRTWQGFVRTALGLSWTQVRDQRLSFQVLLQQLGVPGLLTMLQRRLASWLGHIARLDPSRITWQMLFGTLADRRTPPATRQHSHLTYYSRVTALLQQLPDVDDRIWVRQAQRRDWWHTVVQKLEIAPQVRRTHTHDRYNLRALGRHVVGAPVDLRCPIDGCNFVARNAQSLTAHINYKHGHGEVSFDCPHCQRHFGRKGSLTLHLRTCSLNPEALVEAAAPAPGRQSRARTDDVRPFACPLPNCGRTFTSVSQLNRHTSSQCLSRPDSGAIWENGSWQLPCSICGKLFSSSQALGIHNQRSHS